MNEASELVSAVNSIEPNGCTYAYTLQSANLVDCEVSGSLVHGYATEVCITGGSSTDCLIESDGNDICWNAILTEADLNELVDPYSVDPVSQIHLPQMDDGSQQKNGCSSTTAQLTAVEPHDLDLIASSGLLGEDQQLFYHSNGLQGITFEAANSNNHVLTATSNVVTCINDANMTAQWSAWPQYQNGTTMSLDGNAAGRSDAELILSQLECQDSLVVTTSNSSSSQQSVSYLGGNGTATLIPMSISHSIPVTLTATKHILQPSVTVPMSSSCNSMAVSSSPMGASLMSSNSTSPTNFHETANSHHPWSAESKSAALDLDSLVSNESLQQF